MAEFTTETGRAETCHGQIDRQFLQIVGGPPTLLGVDGSTTATALDLLGGIIYPGTGTVGLKVHVCTCTA